MTKQAIHSINQTFLAEIDPDGRLNITSCLQCGRCSAGCTMRLETDLLPHQLGRMVALGMEKEALNSGAIWSCISCHTCVSRCPMAVDTPALIDALRERATSAPSDLKNVRIFNEVFLASVKRFGRTYEMGLMASYKIRAKDFFSDLAKLPTMLRKGKMSLMPSGVKDRGAIRNIFNKTLRRSGR